MVAYQVQDTPGTSDELPWYLGKGMSPPSSRRRFRSKGAESPIQSDTRGIPQASYLGPMDRMQGSHEGGPDPTSREAAVTYLTLAQRTVAAKGTLKIVKCYPKGEH